MMKRCACLLGVLLLLALCSGCRQSQPGTAPVSPPPVAPAVSLTVFAGAASKPALTQLVLDYQRRTGVKVEVTFGGSGSVLTQFSQEHYGDVYIPGSDDFMDRAEKQDTVLQDTRTPLVYLVPVINVPKGNPKHVKALADLARADVRVVIGEPKSVCLGEIGMNALKEEGLWEKVSPRVASYATSCENVLQALLLGEADAVIGWDVFTRQQPDKVETVQMPAALSRPRNIPAAVIKWCQQPQAAKALITFLSSPEAKVVWEQKGYTPEPPR